MRYRTDIDALRALAVTTVLVFHFFPNALPLGFLGVDLFFVISGFLIGHHIVSEARERRFSFAGFYYRRVKRILPAAFVVLAATTAGAAALMTQPDFAAYARSALATLTFTANIFFWRDGGYFGPADELKPLLHMWSLSVEEQFYLIFPLALVLLMRLVRRDLRWLAVGLAAVVLASFALNVLLIRAGGANPAFFLLPTRVWQFGVGALAALAFMTFDRTHKAWQFGAIGAALTAGFALTIPGAPKGLIVTLAAGWWLARGVPTGPILDALLRNPAARYVGLISFSLYLWHWPIVVFLKYFTIEEPPLWALWAGFGLTALLSVASYHGVEQPFRRRFSPRLVFGLLGVMLVASAALIAPRLAEDPTKTLAGRIAAPAQTHFRCPALGSFPYGASRACLLNGGADAPYDLALIGNSHAQMYAPALAPTLKLLDRKAILIPLNACLPTTDINISPACLRLARGNFAAYAADARIKTIVFALTWTKPEWISDDGVVADPDRTRLAAALIALVERVEAAGKRAFLVGPIPLPGYNVPSDLGRALRFGREDLATAMNRLNAPRGPVFDDRYAAALATIDAALPGRLIRPHDRLCDAEVCAFGDPENGAYFADDNHLSAATAQRMAPLFVPAFGASPTAE